jgi:DNA-binding NtrC family response regulator
VRRVVLFVDDEPAVLEGIRDTLRKEPYDVLTANSAVIAMDYLIKRRVDVIVSDECMPRVSGSDLLSRVRHEYPDVCRIMLTGEASLDVSVRAINDGLYRFLSKPVKPDELTRVVRDALRMKELSEERALRPEVGRR